MSVLTAEVCARAVIAAARVYGDDPVAAMTSPTRRRRRAAVAAARAISGAGRIPAARAVDMLGLAVKDIRTTISPRDREAQAAAEGVLLEALDWRPAEAGAQPLAQAVEPGGCAPPVIVLPRTPCAPDPAPEPPAPLPPPAAGKVRTLAPGRVKREVLTILGEDPSTGPELMALVGVAEAAIRAALSALKDEGRIVATAMTAEGWRAQTWRLAGGEG